MIKLIYCYKEDLLFGKKGKFVSFYEVLLTFNGLMTQCTQHGTFTFLGRKSRILRQISLLFLSKLIYFIVFMLLLYCSMWML